MHSPFPGMDPYLEQASLWGGVHTSLITVMRELLNRSLPERFFVGSEDCSIETIDIHAPYLTIQDARTLEDIATLELISPVNKEESSSAQREFLLKRARTLRSSTHWIEIDLLRAGTRSLNW